MKIRPAQPADQAAIAQVHQSAFGQAQEAQLVDKIWASDRYISQLSLLAEVEGKIVGHVLLSWVDLVSEETQPVLALAPLAVQPQYQNQGIGSALVQAGLEAAAAVSSLVVVLGHPQFYHRFGFEPAINSGILCPFEVPAEVFMVKWLQPNRQQFSGSIVYPSAFDEV